MCLAQGHNAVMQVRLEPAVPQTESSTLPLRSLSPPVNVPTDRSKVVFLLWIFFVICVCFVALHPSQQIWSCWDGQFS